jgi:hypothetical protein
LPTYPDHPGGYSQVLSLYKERNKRKLNYSEVNTVIPKYSEGTATDVSMVTSNSQMGRK